MARLREDGERRGVFAGVRVAAVAEQVDGNAKADAFERGVGRNIWCQV